jgi:hypothetical protein
MKFVTGSRHLHCRIDGIDQWWLLFSPLCMHMAAFMVRSEHRPWNIQAVSSILNLNSSGSQWNGTRQYPQGRSSRVCLKQVMSTVSQGDRCSCCELAERNNRKLTTLLNHWEVLCSHFLSVLWQEKVRNMLHHGNARSPRTLLSAPRTIRFSHVWSFERRPARTPSCWWWRTAAVCQWLQRKESNVYQVAIHAPVQIT